MNIIVYGDGYPIFCFSNTSGEFERIKNPKLEVDLFDKCRFYSKKFNVVYGSLRKDNFYIN